MIGLARGKPRGFVHENRTPDNAIFFIFFFIKMQLSSSIVAALAFVSSTLAVNPFLNHVNFYGVPSTENGGAFFAGSQAEFIACWENGAPKGTFDVTLDKEGRDAGIGKVHTQDLTRDMYKVIREAAIEQYDLAKKGDNFVNLVTQAIAQNNWNGKGPFPGGPEGPGPKDDPKDDSNGPEDNDNAGPAVPPGAINPDGESNPHLVKRGLATLSFIRNGGLLMDVPDRFFEKSEPLCKLVTFDIKPKTKSSSSYKLEFRLKRKFWMDKKWVVKHVSVIALPKSKTHDVPEKKGLKQKASEWWNKGTEGAKKGWDKTAEGAQQGWQGTVNGWNKMTKKEQNQQ